MIRKVGIFTAVFVLTGVLAGNGLTGFSEGESFFHENREAVPAMASVDDEVWRPESGTYAEFVSMVQGQNSSESEFIPFDEADSFEKANRVEDYGQAQFVYLPGIPLSEELQRFTYTCSQEAGVEYELILAIMWRESRFDVNAVGYNKNGTTDSGIMQINDVNKAWLRDEYGITDLMDPYQNICAGVTMLSMFLKEYDDAEIALMAYHYGENGMLKKLEQGVTTNNQVAIALNKRDAYKTMLESV